MHCPECTHENRPSARYCEVCGTQLRGWVATSHPAVQTDTRAAGEDRGAGAERRQLTVMFCDLVGSTALSQRLDPEDLRELLAAYQSTCAAVVNRLGGYIARYIGDGLLVYFGYPQAHEDDAHRAVRAGLGIAAAVPELGPGSVGPEDTLAVRVGIATGLVVAGDIGSGEQREKMAIVGETPNIAARLQALAEPGTVVIGAGTRQLVQGLFVLDDLGPQHLKGMSAPVDAYRVRAESGALSRFEAKARVGLTPLVGREEESERLLERWRRATDGSGQVVLLSGAAGIGKSRVVHHFHHSVQSELGDHELCLCSPYYQNSALHPVIVELRRRLRIETTDDAERKLAKLDAMLRDLGLPADEFTPVLAPLLSLPVDAQAPAGIPAPEEFKKKTLETLAAMVQALASRGPFLMVVEDAHWIDPTTLELLHLMGDRLRSRRFLLLITSRGGFEPDWGGHAHVTALALDRLGRGESAAMVAKLTGAKRLPDEVVDQILVKTDGVPLFIEELTKAVLESGLLEDAGDRWILPAPLPPLAIPSSLQDSLMARVDRLGPAKEVAQLAATLGRSFSRELLAAVSPFGRRELDEALSKLVAAGLIYPQGLSPRVTYEFKHALVRDAAYQSLLKSTRRQYHQRIAQALEMRFPEIAGSEPELLAQHYTEAHLLQQAVSYWQRAGERASERSATAEAIAHFSEGLRLVARLPETPERARQELGLRLGLGPVLMFTRGWAVPEVEQTYLRARELCRQVGTLPQLFTSTWGLWLLFHQRAELQTAHGLTRELLALAERSSDPALLLQAHHAAWTTLFSRAELNSCRDHAARGLALYDADAHRSHAFLYGGHDPGVCGTGTGAMALWLLGYADQALEQAREAVRMARALSHPMTLAVAQFFLMHVHQFRRETRLVQAVAETLMALSKEQGFRPSLAAANVLHGWALASEGSHQPGIAEIRQGLAAWPATGSMSRLPDYLALLADAYRQTGQVDEGLRVLAEASECIEKTGERRWEAEIHRLRGELLIARSADHQREAEACFNSAIIVARRQQALSLELRAGAGLCRLSWRQGNSQQARQAFKGVYDRFTEGFQTPDLQDAAALLDELSHGQRPRWRPR